MNATTFYGSKVEEDPQEVIEEIYKFLYAMGLTINEQDLATYQLNDLA